MMNSNSPTDPRETVCTEDDFKQLLPNYMQQLFRLHTEITRGNREWHRRLWTALHEEASEVEELLDDYGARNNATFATLGELIASLRGFAALGYCIKQIDAKYRVPGFLDGGVDEDGQFAAETKATLAFSQNSASRLLVAVADEYEKIIGSKGEFDIGAKRGLGDAEERRQLPPTLSAVDVDNIDAQIASLLAAYERSLSTLDQRSTCRRFNDVEEMKKFVATVCDEAECRFFEAKIHNLQSRYDTFVKNTTTEVNDPSLMKFRHVVSAALQLLQSMVHLVHFYERHEDVIRSHGGREIVKKTVDKHAVLDRLLNYGLYFAHRYLRSGRILVEQLKLRYSPLHTVEVELPAGVMLHARPASLISKVVLHHGIPVEMRIANESCYAGSIMQIILLAGKHLQQRQIVFQGDRRPLRDLVTLFAAGLGEAGLESLPGELEYLRRN